MNTSLERPNATGEPALAGTESEFLKKRADESLSASGNSGESRILHNGAARAGLTPLIWGTIVVLGVVGVLIAQLR